MRTTFDFTPFNRIGIGFDRLFELLETGDRLNGTSAWPNYDISRAGEDSYRISMAVPGFSQADLEITQKPNLLIISGRGRDDDKTDYLYRGVDHRSFTRRFNLADYVEVTGADLSDGILTIELKREVPEAMRPRRISIATPHAEAQKRISAQAA